MIHLHTLIDNKYFLQTLLEEGERLSAYKVWHSKWEVYLQVKVSHHLEDSTQRFRLHKEAQEWIELGIHPNIVPAYFLRELHGLLWLFFPWIPCRALKKSSEPNLEEVSKILEIALEVANGVDYLHSEGGIHGNLNRDNILLCHDGRIRINNIRWDYWHDLEKLTKGLRSNLYSNPESKLLKDKANMRLAYLPPEYFSGKEVKKNTKYDVYSFGILLYEMLLGKLPLYYPKIDIEDMFQAYTKDHQKGDMRCISEINANLPQSLISLIQRCLEPNLKNRISAFPEIISQLKDIYEDLTKNPYIYEDWSDTTLLAMSLNNQSLGHIDSGEWDKAEKILHEVSQLDSTRVNAQLNLELLRLRREKISISEFYHRVDRCKLLNEKQTLWVQGKACLEYGGFISQVLEDLKRFRKSSHEKSENLSLLQANLHYRFLEYNHARDIFRSYAAEEEKQQDFWYRLGAISLALGKNTEAQQAWEIGLRQQLPSWDLVVVYSMFLATQGKWGEARQRLDQASQNFSCYLQSPVPKSSWSQVKKFRASINHSVLEIAISQDQKHISAWTADGYSRIWEWPSGRERQDLNLSPTKDRSKRISRKLLAVNIHGMAVSADGEIGVGTQGDELVRVWDLQKGKCQFELEGHENVVTAIAMTKDGERAISGGSFSGRYTFPYSKTGIY